MEKFLCCLAECKKKFNELITNHCTGNAKEFANKLNMVESTFYLHRSAFLKILNEIKPGLFLFYNRSYQSYCYIIEGTLVFGITFEKAKE